MGKTKEANYSKRQTMISEYARALAHPARIAIIDYMLKHPNCICKDIVEELNLSQSTISQHLKVLKKAKLIQGEIDSPSVCYCINPTTWRQAHKSLHTFLGTPPISKPNCC